MLDLRKAKRIVILGGGTAGWFAALHFRRVFSPAVEVRVIASQEIGIIGVGEGGLLNFVSALKYHDIDLDEFVRETGAAFKLGFSYEGWRTGAADDRYFHPFASEHSQDQQIIYQAMYPLILSLMASGTELDRSIPEMDLVYQIVSQEQASQSLESGHSGLNYSFHFDSHRVAKYLQKIALARGVVHQDAKVDELIQDERGYVTQLRIGDSLIDLDFLVDSSGLARLGIGKTMKSKWRSFSEYLVLDSAVPFHMKHPEKNPHLVTRAIAMNAGWMWQIPVQERVGAGYVFSSQHINAEQTVDEIQKKLGFDIEPMRTIKFTPGCFEEVWVGNVVALGLSSGFVEPLEATSIGQMLEQLRNVVRILRDSHGVIAQPMIDDFNSANLRIWEGIRDFLRMHYDSPRRDTSFWQDVSKTPFPASYADLKSCWQVRPPSLIDVDGYVKHGWQGIFHINNWTYVGTAMGVMSRDAARQAVQRFPMDVREKIDVFLQSAKPRL